MKFSFDSDDPLEVARAARVVEDMLRRGYLLFVEVDGNLERAMGFDPSTNEYIIADGAGEHVEQYESAEKTAASSPEPAQGKATKGRRKTETRRAPAKSTRATGVAPTSGG